MKISWETNVPASSSIRYGPVGGVQEEVSQAELETSHEIIIRHLLDNTQYVLVVLGRDQLGNLATSDQNTFKTALDTRPPKVTNLTVETAVQGSGGEAKAQVIVSWNTDEPASSQVEYGEGTGGSYSNRSVEDTNMVSDHAVIISELTPSKTYHLRAVSRDKENNEGTSDDYSAITARASENALDIILGAIKRSLGFLGNPFGIF